MVILFLDCIPITWITIIREEHRQSIWALSSSFYRDLQGISMYFTKIQYWNIFQNTLLNGPDGYIYIYIHETHAWLSWDEVTSQVEDRIWRLKATFFWAYESTWTFVWLDVSLITINPCRAGGAGAASTAIGLAGTHPWGSGVHGDEKLQGHRNITWETTIDVYGHPKKHEAMKPMSKSCLLHMILYNELLCLKRQRWVN